jgi:hypothetical protein
MPAEKAKYEIKKSKEDTKKRPGVRVNSFVYPDGSLNFETGGDG